MFKRVTSMGNCNSRFVNVNHLEMKREKTTREKFVDILYFLGSSNMYKRSRSDIGFASGSANKRANTGQNESLLTISASFKFHDLKADGVIDSEELLSYFKSDKTVAAIIERLDKNKDGVISYSGNYLARGNKNSPSPILTTLF